jgi:N-acetylneuraminic acid mutarotase
MKRVALIFFIYLFPSAWVKAQFDKSSDWTWMHGDSTVNNRSYYGIKGISSPLNKPGSRYYFSTWTDTSGNFWLFGGQASPPNPVLGVFNDLWRYDLVSHEWTWVSGDTSGFNKGTYGVRGTSAASNLPGGRISAATWVDSNGDLFLFGGNGWGSSASSTGDLNDVWKYNISTNQWTWINGDTVINKPSVFGQKGISSLLNKPGCRTNTAYWQDSAKNVWIFGGYSAVAFSLGGAYLNELWKYEPILNQWTWMTGDTSFLFKTFGVKGVESPLNNIPGRYRSTFWKDNSGNFWVFGGYGCDKWFNEGWRNDLWRYKPSTNNWTWMSCDTVNNSPGVYGILGIPNDLNKPGGRQDCVSWADSSGNFYLFGGYGYGETGSTSSYLSDLWEFEPLINKWTWIKGEKTQNTIGFYGTMGIPSVDTKPGARFRHVSWTDGEGNLWLFSGRRYGVINSYLNDLWKLSTTKFGINTWTGANDTSWENPLNWSCGIVPDVYSNVIINFGIVVINSNVIIKSLRISSTADLQVSNGFTLAITH